MPLRAQDCRLVKQSENTLAKLKKTVHCVCGRAKGHLRAPAQTHSKSIPTRISGRSTHVYVLSACVQ
eukprot:14928083-Alexandrium_andersonii.AAC.1